MEGALNCHNQPTKHFRLLRVFDLNLPFIRLLRGEPFKYIEVCIEELFDDSLDDVLLRENPEDF